MLQKGFRFILVALGALACLLATAWTVGALYFDLPVAWLRASLAFIYGGAMLGPFLFVKGRWRAMGIVAGLFAVVLVWWFTIKPTDDRNWQPDVARKAWADVKGDEVTVHNVRNFDYRSETDYTPHWETRTVLLSKLTDADLAINYWGSAWIAHPIASFLFADSTPLAFSIETRKAVGQTYSALRGFYRQYDLIYIPADERDVLLLRANYRHEEVYLYHTTVSAERARSLFLEYLKHLNRLHEKPEFYNAITDNCTTNIRAANVATVEHGNVPSWDWKVLLNGKMDELLYARGFVDRSLPFAELKARSLINPRAKAAGESPNFSELIRVGLPLPENKNGEKL